MSSGIQGPGGASGPGGPTGPTGAGDLDGVDDATGAGGAARTEGAAGADRAAGADPVVALAADLDAGRIGPDEALARLLEEGLGADLEPAQRAELEQLFADLLANDPYLAGLARELGATPLTDDSGIPGGGGQDRG